MLSIDASLIIRIFFYSFVLFIATNSVRASEVIDDFYRTSSIEQSREVLNQSQPESIDPFTGTLRLQYVDFSIPGNGGLNLNVIRSYNSGDVDLSKSSGNLGTAWSLHFGKVSVRSVNSLCGLTFVSTLKNPVIEMPGGQRQLLINTSATTFTTNQRWRAECVTNGLHLYSPDGIRYEMTQYTSEGTFSAWYTKRIVDRNNNYININYIRAGSNEISSVTTSDSRSLTFIYETVPNTDNRRIIRITDDRYNSYNYNYVNIPNMVAKYQLANVIRPDNLEWKYQYNNDLGLNPGSYHLVDATYPTGGSINYRYDHVSFDIQSNPSVKTTVVSGKTTSTGGKWSYSYAPSSSSYDTTTVDTPEGRITYKHIGAGYVSSGNVWQVGLLVSKQLSNQTENYTWNSQYLSDQNYLRPGQFVRKVDQDTYSPILVRKTISRNGVSYITEYSSFNAYGAPQTITETGPNYTSRSTNITYYNNISKWILNIPQDETSQGNTTTRSFDSNGNIQTLSYNGVQTSYGYDYQGNLTQKTTPRSLVTSYSNYYRGIARTEQQEEGVTLYRGVDAVGNITYITNGEGKTTQYQYDNLNRKIRVYPPSGNATSISYGANYERTSRAGFYSTTYIDDFGKPTNINNSGGITTRYTHDELGRKTFQSYPNSSIGITYKYDALGRITSLRNGDGSYRYFYYENNNVRIINERQYSTTYHYKSYGDPEEKLLIGISTPISAMNLSIQRNTKDLMTGITQSGTTRSYAYDSRNYLISVNDPETGGTISYLKDNANNITTKSKIGSGSINYTYDRRNRLTTISYPSGNAPSSTFSYYKTDLIKQNSQSGISHFYNYDTNTNLIDETLSVDNLNFKLLYTYDANDKLATFTYPDPNAQTGTVFFYPDSLGRPTKIYPLADVNYHPNGIVKNVYYANNVYTTQTLNSRQWPELMTVAKSTGTLANTKLLYDYAGNITSVSDNLNSQYNRNLSYDAADRLINAMGSWGSGVISYDGRNNIMSQNYGGSSLSYNYDGNNRLSSVSGVRSYFMSYDPWGNVINNGRNTFRYDDAQNLRCIDCTLSTVTRFDYDANNLRVRKIKNGLSTYYVYAKNGDLILEYTPGRGEAKQFSYLAGKQIAMRRLFGANLDLDRDGIADAVEINQRPGIMTAGEDLTYYHPDVVGSPIASTTHPAGLLSWKENYKPYGERQVKSTLAGINNTRFASKPEDEESGLAYFGARYYDPTLGRFMGVDPVAPNPEQAHSINRYAYANNNPYKFVDPDGRIPVDTVWDAGNIIYDVGKIGVGYFTGNQVLITDGGTDLAADGAAFFIPYFPAGITKLRHADDVAEAVTKGSISVDDALGKASEFLKDGVPVKSIDGKTGVQFIQEFTENGQRITKRIGLDLNPNSSHVQQLGPHLNLQTQINGKIQKGTLADPHIPIDAKTIRSGDY